MPSSRTLFDSPSTHFTRARNKQQLPCRYAAVFFLFFLTSLWGDAFIRVDGPNSPEVAYSLHREEGNLILAIDAESFEPDGSGITMQVGLSADQTVTLESSQAKTTQEDGRTRFAFTIPASKLLSDESDWRLLRLGFAVEWSGGPDGQPRQREQFLHLPPRAAHAGLSGNPAEWQPIDLEELEREALDRQRQIHIPFEQPMDGKATVVIEDTDGNRVRNLISGQSMPKGRHSLVWDGLDEAGATVLPGEYRWRAISHPGLTPKHEFDFVNAPGSNHGTFHAATTNGEHVFLGTPVSEGGHDVVMLEKDGTFVRGFLGPHGTGLARMALAADDRYLYAFYDGTGWGTRVERHQPDWKAEMKINLVRFDLETGGVADYPDNNRTPLISAYEVGPGSPDALPDEPALKGAALLNGRLYVADSQQGKIFEVDPQTGEVMGSQALPGVLAIAAGKGSLFAITAPNQLLKISQKPKKIADLAGKPTSLWVDEDHRFYVSDTEAEVIRVLDEKGKELSVIGTPGGIKDGLYDPQRLQNPACTALLDGLLWVTERDRWQPKRFAAYDGQTGKMAYEFFGPTNYGAQGAGFDCSDHTHWIGQGVSWKLDFDEKTATPLTILGGETSRNIRKHKFYRQDGRTFLISSGKATYIQEFLPDGTLKPLALLSSAHQYSYSQHWRPPQAFLDAFQRDYPDINIQVGVRGGIERGKPGHGYGMLWVDRNGDGEMQAEEIEFATAASNMAGSAWSHDFHDLTLRVPATVDGEKRLVVLEPDGFYSSGVPRYPALNDAVESSLPIDLPGSNQIESVVDRFGNTVLNSTPDMRAFAPDGRLLWTFPNNWSGVHGSHRAPLPSTGELQGALFFTGIAPLDDQADVFVMNGNHGRAFVMTTDGLYLDEMFPDVRLMNHSHASGVGILGGEPFGGVFGRSEKNGNFYFQGGGISYRIYRIDGLGETLRSEGSLTVSPEQSESSERHRLRSAMQEAPERQGVISWLDEPPTIDGSERDWQTPPTAQWDRDRRFSVTVHAGIDQKNLYLHYTVRDDSPWVNNGNDWQTLFKTGDGIDLQLGTDESANPQRGDPVPGDLRLFIAPSGDENLAVLYRHRVPGAKEEEGVVFQSPWRSEKVDVVRQLDSVEIAVQRSGNLYRVEASVPLAELGLENAAGKTLRGDFGVIYGDAEGTINIFRDYWSNQATGLVNDVPGEIMLTPSAWGELQFAAPGADAKKESSNE